MTTSNPDHFVIFLDSGGPGAILNVDATNTPTYASWSQNLALPINVQNVAEYEVALSECVYQTGATATAGMFVYLDILMASSVGSEAYNLVIRIPPVTKYELVAGPPSGPPSGTTPYAYHCEPAPLSGDRWPTLFTQTSTVVPWMPLGSGVIQRINVTFTDTFGNVVRTSPNIRPFNLTLVVRRKRIN
jgi:hypothetical protein